MKKSKSIQKIFRNKVFNVDQYWNINYTEHYFDGSEKDFKTFIRAKSYDFAKLILIKKLKEEGLVKKIKSVHGFMFHGNYKLHMNRRLTFENWDQIKKASFPNYNNVLFKKEMPRDEGKSNRFNYTNYELLSTIGFKKGKDNWSHINRKGIYLPIEERKGMIYKGKWIKWDKEEMEKTKQQIIEAFKLLKNNRKKTAEYLKVGRNTLYKMMTRIEPLDWWNKEYPYVRIPPPRVSKQQRSSTQKKVMKKRMSEGEIPFSFMTEEDHKIRIENIKKAKKEKRKKFYSEIIPKIKETLPKFKNSRKKTAEFLGLKQSHFDKILVRSKKIYNINWSNEFPTKYSRTQKTKKV